MRTLKYLIFSILPLLAACNGSEETSDGYGHFEATELFLSTEIPGKLVFVGVKEGDHIERGDTLYMVDTVQLSLRRDQLLASMQAVRAKTLSVSSELAVLESKAEYLEGEMVRLQKLWKDGAATSKQVDDLKAEQDMLESQTEAVRTKLVNTNRGILAELEPIKVNITMVEDQISRSFGLSPIRGTVLAKYAENSEMAAPGKPILKVADISQMKLKVYLTADQLNILNIGSEVSVYYAGLDGTLTGKVSAISSEAEFTPKNVQTRDEKANLVYAVDVAVENNGQLRIGMPGEILIGR